MTQAEDDYWQNFDAVRQVRRPTPWLAVNELLEITPLGQQLGVWPKKNAPDALQEALFGSTDPTNAAQSSTLNTYAILDAAKAPFLVDLLEKSGLPFCSIFKGGGAYDELSAAAPYVVALNPHTDFSRQLFSDTGKGAQLWQSNCASYIRSAQSLDDIVRHLRKIYRIQGTTGQTNTYLRFWAPETLRMLLPVFIGSYEHAAGFFSTAIASIMWRRPNRTSFIQLIACAPFNSAAKMTMSPQLERRFIGASISQRTLRLQQDAEAEISEHDPSAASAMRKIPEIRRLCHTFRIDQLGIRSCRTAAALLSVIYITGINILQEPAFHYATRNPFLSPEAKARQLLLAYVMTARMDK